MAYIDYTYYTETFKGEPITKEQFERLVERASDLVDQMTTYGLQGVDLTQAAPIIQNNVKKATAAQVEYMASQGGGMSIHGGAPASVSIGNFTYSEGGNRGQGNLTREQQMVSPAVIAYLKPTGLLYRGVSTYGC
jgi:hypothetical protein